MIKKIVIGLLFAAIPVAALVSIRRANAQSYPDTGITKNFVNYFYDSRTHLCFASMTFITAYGARVTSFTNVPCTDDVRRVINNQPTEIR